VEASHGPGGRDPHGGLARWYVIADREAAGLEPVASVDDVSERISIAVEELDSAFLGHPAAVIAADSAASLNSAAVGT
jgi:hypothetical protein